MLNQATYDYGLWGTVAFNILLFVAFYEAYRSEVPAFMPLIRRGAAEKPI